MSAVDELKAMMLGDDPFVVDGRDDHEVLRLAAANERLAQQRPHIRALDMRAADLGIDRVKSVEELVPLLFAHSVYKSYPESFITQGRWKNMSAWLDTVSTGDITAVDMDGCIDVDDWLDRLEASGQNIVVSSGTSGKNSFLVMDAEDMAFANQTSVKRLGYPHRIAPDADLPVALMAPSNVRMRFAMGFRAYKDTFARPGATYSLSDERVRVADTLQQAIMRRRMMDGTATPSEVAAYESGIAAKGKQAIAEIERLVDDILRHQHEPMVIMGSWAVAWRLMEIARSKGIPDGSFHPQSVVTIAGGLKGMVVPDDYEAQMIAFLGNVIRPKVYAMSEHSVVAPMCEAGAYHWPKSHILFVLDESGERLVPIADDGRVTGRVGSYDPIWHGRWGGIVTGDKVTANFNPCACGRIGPTIEDSIQRYSELSAGGDDKLTCGGTIEEYIRGATGG